MNSRIQAILSGATLLAVNLLYFMVWGFAAIGKFREGMPAWFAEKFGGTLLGVFPGPRVAFWLLAAVEFVGLGLALVALCRGEFVRGNRGTPVLHATVVWSLFVFLMLGFGLWLTGDFNGGFQQFVYFTGTLLACQVVASNRVDSH